MYRNYHARIAVGTYHNSDYSTVSVFVADIGEGTKRAARELVREHFSARRVALKHGRSVESARKDCLTFEAKAVKAMRTKLNRKAAAKAKAAAKLAKAA